MFAKKTASSTSAKEVDGLDFEAEIALRSYRSEKIAWALVGVFAVTTCMAVAAVMMLTPLKQTLPYYIYVNKETGATQAVVVDDPAAITSTEAVTRYWLARYVGARERYLYRLQQSDYDFVTATTSSGIAKDYTDQFEAPSPKTETLGGNTEERIAILSVQVMPGAAGRGTVRYQKTVWRSGARDPESSRTYIADIAFEFVPVTGWSTADLLKNPMGFAVAAYRTTAEVAEAR